VLRGIRAFLSGLYPGGRCAAGDKLFPVFIRPLRDELEGEQRLSPDNSFLRRRRSPSFKGRTKGLSCISPSRGRTKGEEQRLSPGGHVGDD